MEICSSRYHKVARGIFPEISFGTTQRPATCWTLSYHFKSSLAGMVPLHSLQHHFPSTRLAFGRRTETNVLWASLCCFAKIYGTQDTVRLRWYLVSISDTTMKRQKWSRVAM